MVELDLSHNNISQIKPETFAGNERLQTLTLAHNFITQIAPYQFPPLKHLVRTFFVRSWLIYATNLSKKKVFNSDCCSFLFNI
jgi:Leucine-rich repeat (LRR) protein